MEADHDQQNIFIIINIIFILNCTIIINYAYRYKVDRYNSDVWFDII